MKKLFLFAWMMMLSIVAMAQTVVVVDKDGNRIPYDPAKVSSVDFQTTPPGFTVNHETGSDLYTFDKVQSILGVVEPRYIDIDWEKNTLDSYDAETGVAVITFKDDVPIMGRLDCFVMPESQNYVIRVIESVDKVEGKTVTLTTSKGDLGNLFMDTQIVLGFGNKAEAAARARGAAVADIIYPTKVELFDGKKYFEVYNADKVRTRADGDDEDDDDDENNEASAKTRIKMDCEVDDMTLLNDNNFAAAEINTFNYNVNLSGVRFMTFAKKKWYEFWKGELSNIDVELSGHRDYTIKATHIVDSPGEVRDKRTSESEADELSTKSMLFTFNKDGKNIRAQVNMKMNVVEFGYLAEGQGSAKTHIANASDFHVLDHEISYTNPDDSVFNTELSMSNASVEGVFPYQFAGEFRINMFGEDVYNVDYGIGKTVSFCRKEVETSQMAAPVEGNSGSVNVLKTFCSWDVSSPTDNLIEKRIDHTYFIPGHIELNGKEADMDVDINVEKDHKLTFHATHQDEHGHIYDSKNALVHIVIDSPQRKDDYYDVTDEDGNLILNFSYKTLDEGGTVTAELYNPYYKNVQGFTAPKRVWTFHPKGFELECMTGGQTLEEEETTCDMTFRLRKFTKGQWVYAKDQLITFDVDNGAVSPTYVNTNDMGTATTTFTQTSNDYTSAVVEASYYIHEPDDLYRGATTGVIYKNHGGVYDEELKKAEKLKENTYEIKNKKTGETEIRDYKPQWSEWTKGTDVIELVLEDADDDGGTKGMIEGFIPINMSGLVLMLTGQQFENSPGAMLYFGVYDGKFRLSANFKSTTGMTSSNLKPESRIMLRPVKSVSPARRRATGDEEDYTGEYELLFYLAFQNTMNPMTGEAEEGDEYEVYGRGTMTMHIPTVTYFVAHAEDDWVKVGESTKVILDRFDEEGATWDWNDTQIIGQSADKTKARNGENEGFFSWDAATQTLTSLKSNDNKDVWVYLGLKSKPSVKAPIQVATGEGWKYTMIKPSVDEFTYTGYGYLSFSFDFAPKESEDEKIDFNALEIDPATNPNGYFSIQRGYGPQGWPIYVDNAPAGEYTVRIWVKSNHDVNCTIKVISKPEE